MKCIECGEIHFGAICSDCNREATIDVVESAIARNKGLIMEISAIPDNSCEFDKQILMDLIEDIQEYSEILERLSE